MVMGDAGTAEVLLPQGGDAHDFQLRPSQAQDLATADVVIWLGPEMTPWLDRALKGLGRDEGLVLLDAPETMLVYRGGDEDAAQHEDGHNHAAAQKSESAAHEDHTKEAAHGHDHEEEGHAHEGVDPHAWLEPENARIWLGLIADALAKADPEQAAMYHANADAARQEIDATEAEVQAVLAPVKDKPFAVMHAAYGYFAAHFGVQIVGSLRSGDAVMPGAGHISDLQAGLQQSGAVCIFPEANHDASSAEQMAEATGLRLGRALDPEGSMLPPSTALYGDLLLGLATTMAECLADK
jgi:zinc transport system substrate-binding protein